MVTMALEKIQPSTIHEARGYTHVVKAAGAQTVYISGQVGVAPDGSVADGIEAQAKQAFSNLNACLVAAGATAANVAKITILVVGYSPDVRPALLAARQGLFDADSPPASTLIGVQALAQPNLLIEVEAIAVLG
jgi:enamine deaminase RidA (YjgF/YER057c/UK114 family)